VYAQSYRRKGGGWMYLLSPVGERGELASATFILTLSDRGGSALYDGEGSLSSINHLIHRIFHDPRRTGPLEERDDILDLVRVDDRLHCEPSLIGQG
jgi:hypothetical protein